MKKIYVMIGNYGSGKSELALNFAFKAAETGKTELIDLDLVNTYFRLTERGKLVEQKEIRLISPNYACSGVETLSLPAEVASAFAMNWDTVVFDVGGDAHRGLPRRLGTRGARRLSWTAARRNLDPGRPAGRRLPPG